MAAHQENDAKHPLKAQTGWSVQNDHPVRALLTFDGASTPPILGGDYTPCTFTVIFVALLISAISCDSAWAQATASRASQSGARTIQARSFSSSNFGKIRTALDPRIMQFTLKYIF